MTFPRPDFPPAAIAAAKKHALECFPKESCGLIVLGQYVPCENIAADPKTDFRIAPEPVIAAGVHLQAVIHSHPQPFTASPTATDMQGQVDSGVIWGIIVCNEKEAFDPVYWGDFQLEEEILGREFLHGIDDCYTLVRRWFWQNRHIKLAEVPRDVDWWKQGGNLYNSFEKFGFRIISHSATKEGDCILGRVLSKVSNHAGIVLERGLVLHHIQNRLSRREPWGPWLKHISHWLRYEG